MKRNEYDIGDVVVGIGCQERWIVIGVPHDAIFGDDLYTIVGLSGVVKGSVRSCIDCRFEKEYVVVEQTGERMTDEN